MTRTRRRPRPLSDRDIETIRLIARGWTNQQIAKHFGIQHSAFRTRLHHLHKQLNTEGTSDQDGGSVASRIRMVIWAYENGLMSPQGDGAPAVVVLPPAPLAPPAPVKQSKPPAVPDPLIAAVIEICEAIVTDRPRGDLRKIAAEVLRAAGRRRPIPQRVAPAPRT